jgi:hypothetical protein
VTNDLHLFRITCGGCTAGWAGEDRAHCGRCHVTYDSITLYDAHRAGGSCVRPQVLGLVPTKNGIWSKPIPGRRRIVDRGDGGPMQPAPPQASATRARNAVLDDARRPSHRVVNA